MGAFCSSCHPSSFSPSSRHHSAFSSRTGDDDDHDPAFRMPIDPSTPRILNPLSTATSSTRLTHDDHMSHGPAFSIRSCAKKVNAILSGVRRSSAGGRGVSTIELQKRPLERDRGRDARVCYSNDDWEQEGEDHENGCEEDMVLSMHQRVDHNQDQGEETLTWDPHDILHHHQHQAYTINRPPGTGVRESSDVQRPSSLSLLPNHHQFPLNHNQPVITPSHHVIEFPLLQPIQHPPSSGQGSNGSGGRLFAPSSWNFFSPKKVQPDSSHELKKGSNAVDSAAIIMPTDMEWDDYGLEKV